MAYACQLLWDILNNIKYYSQLTYTADVKKLVCQIDCTSVANVPQPKRRNSLFRLRIECGGGYLAIDVYGNLYTTLPHQILLTVPV